MAAIWETKIYFSGNFFKRGKYKLTDMTDFLRHQITDRQLTGYNIPQAVGYSLMLLRMGRIVARNMSILFGFINKPLLLHLVGFLLYHRDRLTLHPIEKSHKAARLTVIVQLLFRYGKKFSRCFD